MIRAAKPRLPGHTRGEMFILCIRFRPVQLPPLGRILRAGSQPIRVPALQSTCNSQRRRFMDRRCWNVERMVATTVPACLLGHESAQDMELACHLDRSLKRRDDPCRRERAEEIGFARINHEPLQMAQRISNSDAGCGIFCVAPRIWLPEPVTLKQGGPGLN
jgi:hypothetical protein